VGHAARRRAYRAPPVPVFQGKIEFLLFRVVIMRYWLMKFYGLLEIAMQALPIKELHVL
jgi:hypothetical protein